VTIEPSSQYNNIWAKKLTILKDMIGMGLE